MPAIDKKGLGAIKGGIVKSMNRLKEEGKEVPQKLKDKLEDVNRRMENVNREMAGGKTSKTQKRKKAEEPLFDDEEEVEKHKGKAALEDTTGGIDPDEVVEITRSLSNNKEVEVSKSSKRQKTMLDASGLSFEPDAKPVDVPMVVAVPRPGLRHASTINRPVVVQLEDGTSVEIYGIQNRLGHDTTFWGKVADNVKRLVPFMEEEDVPSESINDATMMKVNAALMPGLLGIDGRLNYENDGFHQRITKGHYRSFLERISQNVQLLLATHKQVKFSNEEPMTRGRVARTLMSTSWEDQTITVEQHKKMMDAQFFLFTNTIEIVRRELAAHGIAISNMAEKTLNDKFEVSTIATQLVKTIKLKEKASGTTTKATGSTTTKATGSTTTKATGSPTTSATSSSNEATTATSNSTSKDATNATGSTITETTDTTKIDGANTGAKGNTETKGTTKDDSTGTGFFDPSVQEFDLSLTPVMIKAIGGHECHCQQCDPEYSMMLLDQAREVVQADLDAEAKEAALEQAKEKFRNEAVATAGLEYRKRVRKEVEAEVKGERMKTLRDAVTKETKEKIRSEVQDQMQREFSKMWGGTKTA